MGSRRNNFDVRKPIREAAKKVEFDEMDKVRPNKSDPNAHHIHSKHVLVNDCHIGNGVRIYAFTNLYGCKIGDNSQLGTFVEIQRGASVGKNCKISSHTFICEGVHIGDNVFVGHGVMFTNDKRPKVDDPNWEPIPTYIEDNVSIGSGAIILPGITIHEGALIGAGALIIKDVPAGETMVGKAATTFQIAKNYNW